MITNNTHMIKRLIPVLSLLLLWGVSSAQRPQSIVVNGELGTVSPIQSRMVCNDAGTIQNFGPHTGSSNDITPDTIFLCFNDQILIDHAGDIDISGDPDPSTTGGVGYAFYECPPSIEGDNLATILTDPCLFQAPFFTDENGVVIGQIGQDSMWISTSDVSGDINFMNDGFLQVGFNSGSPILFWFAPITLDNLTGTTNGYEENAMGEAGPCVNVSTDQAFAVVYLNEITTQDINTNAGTNGCRGSFRVTGGLPEFNGGNYDNISITLASDPSISGDILSGPATHNENVVFTIPQPGLYDITIADGKGCPASFQMDMSNCTGISIFA